MKERLNMRYKGLPQFVTEKEAVENLANAVVLMAANDYYRALKKRKKARTFQARTMAKERISEVELFFHSTWFGILTDLDPDLLMKRLQEEALNDS